MASSTPKATAGGRFGVLNTFVDVMLRSIDNTAAVVWLILYGDTKAGRLADASQTYISRRAGASASAVYPALRRLGKYGLSVVTRKRWLNMGASVYRFLAVASTSQLTGAS